MTQIPNWKDDFPIELPWNSIFNASIKFGKEQAIAWLTNILWSWAAAEILKHSALSELQKRTIIALAWPLFEKVWFYMSSFKHAREIYRSTDPSVRNLILRTAREWTRNTIKDLGVHDPMYLLLMGGWQAINPDVPAWMISFISFVLATAFVGFVDVWVDEIKYSRLKKWIFDDGFKLEKYYESRIALTKKYHMQDILEEMMKEFGLENQQQRLYSDTYYVVNKEQWKTYNGRDPSFRLRKRERLDTPAPGRKSAQLVYTKVNEITPKSSMHRRYYATQKEKLYLSLDNLDKLEDLDDIPYPFIVKDLRKKLLPIEPQKITFERSLSYDPNLLVSIDQIHQDHPMQQAAELKVYKDKALLREAIRFVFKIYPVKLSTMRKHPEERFIK